MAGETPPPPPNQTDLLKQAIEEQSKYNKSISDYNDIIEYSENLLSQFTTQLSESGIKLEDLGEIAANQSGVFTRLGIAVLKAQETFSGFNGVVNPENLMTFSGHLEDLRKMLANGSLAGDKARAVISSLREQFIKGGGASKVFDAALRKGTGAVIDLTKNLFANADRAMASQEAILTLAASTGQLGEVSAKAGDKLQNMNILLDKYNQVIGNAKGETNTTGDQINSFATSLLTIPGAMNAVISVGVAGGKQMSALSAMVKLSHGTHRDFAQVVGDVKKAMVDYGSSLEDSMKFTSGMTELTSKLHAQFDDVKSGLFSVTDAFSKMTDAGNAAGKMQKDVQQMMADYVSRLEATGMSAKQAISMVAGLGQEFGNLSVAQKAFLSGQTGGPGGLMGSIQIDKMIRQGDIAGLRKKMIDMLHKQIGTIVTLEEGSKSEAAASRLLFQRRMMREGPMGSLFKSDQDADRFAEVLKAEEEGKPLPAGMGNMQMDAHGLENTIKAGSNWEAKTHSEVSNISTDLHIIRNILEVNSLSGVQKALTAAALPRGEERADNSAESKMADNLNNSLKKFGLRATNQAKTLNTEFNERSGSHLTTDQRKGHTKDAVDDLITDLKKLPTVLKSASETLKQSVSTDHLKKAENEERALAKDIEDRRVAAGKRNVSKEDKQKLLETAQMEEDKLEEYKKWRAAHFPGNKPTVSNIPTLPRGTTSTVGLGYAPRGVPSAGAIVASAHRAAPGRAGYTTNGATVPDVVPNVQINKSESSGRLNVNVYVDVKDAGGQSASTVPQGGT